MAHIIPIQMGKILYELTANKEGRALEEAVQIFLVFTKEQQLLSKISYIIAAFEAYAKQQQGIVPMTVTTVHPLSKKIIQTIEESIGKKIELTEKIDPSLIGGIIMQTPDVVLDGSVKTQLRILATRT